MKVRWRQHEITLVTLVFITIGIGYFRDLYSTDPAQYAGPFINNGVPFNLYRNVVLPDVMMALLIYSAYLFINLFMLRRFVAPRKFEAGNSKISLSFKKISLQELAVRVFKKYAWLFIQLVLIIFLIGSVSGVATYLRHEWQFHYPGFSIFFNKNIPNSQLSLGAGFFAATTVLVLYGIYLCGREFIINWIKNSRQREYNISICNKVTFFLVQFILLAIVLNTFRVIHESQFFAGYFLSISAIFAMFISNVYWLFPKKGDAPFFSKKIVVPLLSTSFVYSIPFVVFVHEAFPVALIFPWALQLFIITPITWWYYQAYKDKILQLRGVEKQLVKSKTDLQFLRSQINPHFLFNVLNTLYGTALQENAERTAEGIQKLGDMMRFMLHENNLDFIDMNKEIDYLKNYIALQKLRTQSSPDIIIEDNINEENCHHKIAPMLLIPLVENAFKHGISLKEKSWIKINLSCTPKEILFEVHNSVHTKTENDPERERSGIGFKNVMERLKLIYRDKFQVSVNKDDKKFFVKLAIQPS